MERVVAAGWRAADPGDRFGQEVRAALAATSGLSAEGIELALAEHLETHPTSAHLDALLAAAGTAPRCHVVLAANVCTAALRALAVAVATAPTVFVRPSRRDPGLAVLLVRALGAEPAFAAAGGVITGVDAMAPAPGDELHIHGSDATVRELTASSAPGVVVRGHGTGLGVAVIGAGDPVEATAAAVARDVVPFDQRGCLSPRVVLVEGDSAHAAAFARALHLALADLSTRVPRGPLDPATSAEIALYRATVHALTAISGRAATTSSAPTPARARSWWPPPAARGPRRPRRRRSRTRWRRRRATSPPSAGPARARRLAWRLRALRLRAAGATLGEMIAPAPRRAGRYPPPVTRRATTCPAVIARGRSVS